MAVPPQHPEFIEGIKKLRTASLLYIIATLLLGIGLLAPFIFLPGLMRPLRGPPYPIGLLVGMLAVATAGSILGLVALFAYLVPAFSHLKNYDESSFGTPLKLVKLGYVLGFILLILGAIIFATTLVRGGTVSVFGGLAVLVIGVIFLLIGLIGLIIGMFKLKDKTDESIFLAAGILFIIGIFISIVSFIAWILVFVGTGSVLKKLQAPPPPPPPPAPPAT